jgi:hypothetical protein
LKNNDPLFYENNGIELALTQQRNKNYSDCINVLQTMWYQADVDQRFSMADQDIWGLIFPGVATYRRKIFNFNIINPIIQAVSGHQRATRKSSIAIPIHKENQKTADQMTKCLYHVHNQSGAYQVYSDCFEQGALVQGLGFLSIYRDLTNDPISGDIKLRYIDMKSCLFDPYMRKHDMSDARFFWTRQFFDKQEGARAFPQFADRILNLPGGTYRDDKFYYMPEVYQIQFPNMIAIDEYWYASTRDCQYLVDRETEETQEWEGDEEDARILMSQFKDRLKIINGTKKTVRRTILANDKVLIDEADPNEIDRYPLIPMTAYCTPDTPYYAYKYRGVVRDMRDAQYLYNRLKVSNLDILDAQQQGLKVKQGALVTPDDALNQGHGRVLSVKKEYSLDDVQPMPIVPPSPVMIQMEANLMEIVHRIAGVDPSAMGIDVDDKAGIISMMRQAATARNLQRLFDQFDEAQRLAGDIIIGIIQKKWTYGKIKQVIGEEPTAEFDNKAFFKYGCKVIQGVLTETQQQLELAQLLHLREIVGDAVPIESIINAMTIQNKDELTQKIMENQKAMQEQQNKMAELQMQQMQVDNQTKLSYAHSQEGLAAERVAKIQTDRAVAEDKLKRAHEQDTHALLNLVKIAKELKGLDVDYLSKQIDLLKTLEPEEKTVEETQTTPAEV